MTPSLHTPAARRCRHRIISSPQHTQAHGKDRRYAHLCGRFCASVNTVKCFYPSTFSLFLSASLSLCFFSASRILCEFPRAAMMHESGALAATLTGQLGNTDHKTPAVSGASKSLDAAVANAKTVYSALNEPLPALVAHLESLDPMFSSIATVRELQNLVLDYVDRSMVKEAAAAAAGESEVDAYLELVERQVNARTTSPEWDTLVAAAARTVQRTHEASDVVHTTPPPTETAHPMSNTTTLTTARSSTPLAGAGPATAGVNILQVDSFSLWSTDSANGEGSSCEFHHNQRSGREDPAEGAMRIFELYVQQVSPDAHLVHDAGSSDSALFPEYRAEMSLDEATPLASIRVSRTISAVEALQNAEKVLKAHPDWLIQHPQWKSVTSALVHATAATIMSDAEEKERRQTDSALQTSTTTASHTVLVDYFRTVGPPQRYLALTELCQTLRTELPPAAAHTLVPITLELAQQAPDDWLTWLESEVLHGLQTLISDVVLTYPELCARADPTAEWMALWVTRPAFAVSVVTLLTERADMLDQLAHTLLQCPNGHVASVVSYLLPILAMSADAKGNSSAAASRLVVGRLCDAVIAFVLRRGLPSDPIRSTPHDNKRPKKRALTEEEGDHNPNDPVSVCTAGLAQVLCTVPSSQLPTIGRWCEEALCIVELQLDGGVPETTTLHLLSLLLVRVSVSDEEGLRVLGHLDACVAAKMEQCTSDLCCSAIHALWLTVMPRHWSSLPKVRERIVQVVECVCREGGDEVSTGGHSLSRGVYTVQHLIALSGEVDAWAWLSERLAVSELCTDHAARGLTRFARLVLQSIVHDSPVGSAERASVSRRGGPTTTPRLTQQMGLLLQRWCTGSCAVLRCALVDEARRRQLVSSKHLYATDGADTVDSLALLDEWLLTIPAEMITREPLETSVDTQMMLDVAVLDQSVSLLLHLVCASMTDVNVSHRRISVSESHSVPTLGMSDDYQPYTRLCAQYKLLTAGACDTRAAPLTSRLALPFGPDSRTLLLRLAAMCRLTCPISYHDAELAEMERALNGSRTANEAGGDALSGNGVDVEGVLLRLLCTEGIPPSSCENWLVPVLLAGCHAEVDEDELMTSFASLGPSLPAVNQGGAPLPVDEANALCLSLFSSNGSTMENRGLQCACALALTAFGDANSAAATLARQPSHVWSATVDLGVRTSSLVAKVADSRLSTVHVLSACGADIFTLCRVHIQRVMAAQAPAVFSCAAAGGTDAVDAYLTHSFVKLLDEAADGACIAHRQAWCVPEDSHLPLPSPLFVSLVVSMC